MTFYCFEIKSFIFWFGFVPCLNYLHDLNGKVLKPLSCGCLICVIINEMFTSPS